MFPGKLASFVGSGQKGPDLPTGAPLAFFIAALSRIKS